MGATERTLKAAKCVSAALSWFCIRWDTPPLSRGQCKVSPHGVAAGSVTYLIASP